MTWTIMLKLIKNFKEIFLARKSNRPGITIQTISSPSPAWCKCFFLVVVLFFLTWSKTVLAESNNTLSGKATKPMLMDTVVVTGKKVKDRFRTGDVNLNATSTFHSVIERDQFAGKIESLAEVIEKEAGVQVRQSGGLGSFSSVSLRGSSSDQVMVFLDGILLNDASGGGVDLSSISLSDVESIEVYRGITPANFGKASIGGAINIRTRRSEKGLKGSLSLGYGSFHTRQGSFFINHKPGKWDYLFSADILDTANDFEFVNDKGTDWNRQDDEEQDRNNAAVQRSNILAKAGYDISKDLRLEFNNQWFYKDQEIPSWNNSEKADTTFDTRRNISTLRLIADDLGSLGLNTHFKINHLWKEETYDDSNGFVGLGKQKNRYTTKRTSGSLYIDCMKASHLISLYTEFRHEDYEPESLLQDKTPRDSSRDSFSATLQDSWFLFGEKLIITPAVRYYHLRDDLESATSVYGLSLDGRSRDEEYLNPKLGIKYKILDWLTLKTNWAEYVREPSFFELFGDRGLFMGNMDLEAEEGTNFDFGLEIDYRTNNKILQRVNLEAAYFYNDVDDLITRTYDARGVGKSVNISGSTIEGFETSFSLDFLKYFRLIGKGTWQDTENQNQVKAFDGKQLPGRFEETYLGRIEAKIGGLKLYAEKILEEDKFYDTANLLEAEDKDETNIGLSLTYKDWILTLEAKNIEDNQYEDFNGYPLPGESYSATLKYKFK